MKRLSIRFFAIATLLLCASATTFAAVDWSQYDFVDAGGRAEYTNKYKVEQVENLSVVNIQQPGFASELGIYMHVPGGISECTGTANKINGAGVCIFLSGLTAQETEVTIKYAPANEITFHIYYVDGGAAKKENVVLNETAYASTGNAAEGNDGNEGTRWETKYEDGATDAEKDAQWWLCKMAEESEFNTVQILWEGAYAKSFKLEISNDSTTWTEIAKIEDQKLESFPYLQTISVGEQKAKYLRFTGIARGTNYGYSFWELRAFTKKEQTLTTIELKAAADLVKVGESLALTTVTKDQDGEAMVAEVTYTVSPADAGTVENGTFKASKFGAATITATSGAVASNTVTVFCYEGDNVALSTNIDNDNKAIAQSEIGTGTSAFYAVDGNEGSVWQGSSTNGTADTEEARTYDSWFVLDLGAYYNVSLVTIKFEGACSEAYHLDFSANNTDWNLAYNYVGAAGVNGHTDMLYGDNLANAQSVRYVRFWSTKAATSYGMKIYEMKVFATPGTAPADNEKPVMGTATLVSSNYAQAVVAVTATDNIGIAFYHVVDAANAYDAKIAAVDGNITITGIVPATTYNFTITAIDLADNESENSAAVRVVTPTHLYVPAAAPAAPTYPANQVKAVYSATYNADCNFGEWGSGTIYTQDDFGKKYVTTENGGWFGLIDFSLNCSSMEYLHLDVWSDEDITMQVFPIWGGVEKFVTRTVEGQTWNSIDIALTDFVGITDWTNIYQIKIADVKGKTFWLNNVYFYTTKEPEKDAEAPTSFTASLVSASYVSADIKAKATDNSGVVIFQVFNGENKIAEKIAVSNVETTFTVNGLQSGTTHNLTVKAVDETGNTAETMVPVTLTTKALPAAAPAPTASASDVLSIYSDTYATATGVNRFMGQWSQTTVETEVELTADNKALLYTTCNYLGWEGVTIDVSSYANLHMDIYIETAGSIEYTPIWKNGEAVKQYDLEAGWNSLNINLKADFPAVDLANIIQMKWANMPSVCIIDNVYFWKQGTTTLINTVATDTLVTKTIENGQLIIIRDGIRYNTIGQVIE